MIKGLITNEMKMNDAHSLYPVPLVCVEKAGGYQIDQGNTGSRFTAGVRQWFGQRIRVAWQCSLRRWCCLHLERCISWR